MAIPRPDEIADLPAEVIAVVAGGRKMTWRRRIGAVERLPTWKHVKHNWCVTPIGTVEEKDLVERAVEIVRSEHPYIA
ncbi:hypothetical protein [Sphingomonas sp. 1P08PE]|uniref:hypothetical protein n=1 Tax=Sphingomonas sp. 1P08PE TaxID=554122 RepID=UPI0039A1F252